MSYFNTLNEYLQNANEAKAHLDDFKDSIVSSKVGDIKDKYESSRTLFEQIDLSKFWFFENEFIKYGGITQWCQYNLDKSLWYNNVNVKDYHPSNHAHSEFAKQIMIPLIEEMI